MARNAEPSGILVIDKPSGPTSHDVVAAVRRAGNLAKVGHTGTLDPFATGVLPLCINRATRLSSHLTDGDKGYTGVFRLGSRTTTQDRTGEVVEERPIPPELSLEDVKRAAEAFVGEITQLPPMYSAVRVDGKRLYELAREGVEIERKVRHVTVRCFDVLAMNDGELIVHVLASKGTYVRTLADDLGEALGCLAHVSELRRTQAGPFPISRAVDLEVATEAAKAGELESLLLPMSEALPDLPMIEVTQAGRERVIVGNPLRRGDVVGGYDTLEQGAQIGVQHEGTLLSLGMVLLGAAEGMAASAPTPIIQPRTVVAPEAIQASRQSRRGGRRFRRQGQKS